MGPLSIDPVVGKFVDFLPNAEFVPQLSEDDVRRFVDLRERGRELLRQGDDAGAAISFKAQLAIFKGNYEPYVDLALLEAGRGSKKAAMEYIDAAVACGFTGLKQIENAEAWSTMRQAATIKLHDVLPYMAELETDYPGWDSFVVFTPPADLDQVFARHAELIERIEAMSPALGPRLTGLWERMISRASASMLESYVEANPEVDDRRIALERLMKLYGDGPLQRWQIISADAAGRLAGVSKLVLEQFPDTEMRPAALVGSAMARYVERDDKGGLPLDAAAAIRSALEEVVAQHPSSSMVSAALVGLVKTEVASARWKQAAKHYDAFMTNHADDPALLGQVRDGLGELALRVGGLPAFQATTLDGRVVHPESLRGKVVIVDFWATWCNSCVSEFPALRKIDARYGEDVVLLGVNLDDADALSAEALGAWIAQQNVPGDHIQDGMSWDSDLVRDFGVKEIPFNVVVGADGAVLAVNRSGKELQRAVRKAIER